MPKLSEEATGADWQLAGHNLVSPLFNAAGLINNPDIDTIKREARLLASTGVGAIQYGSITVPPSPGNEAVYGPPTDYYDRLTGEFTNSKGLPNPGAAEFLRHSSEMAAIAHEAGKLAIVSVSPTKDAGDSVEQAVRLADDFLETDFDLVAINVSCPNIVTDGDGRKPIMGYDAETIHRLLENLWSEFGMTGRLGVKAANHDTPERQAVVPQLARLFRDYPVFDWMEAPNTIPGHIPLDEERQAILSVPGGAGGLSGPATSRNGREQLLLWHRQVGDIMDIVSSEGVYSGEELAWRLGHGAVAASGVHFLWNAEDGWADTVEKMLFQAERFMTG